MADYEVSFPDYFTGFGEFEYESKGFLPDVIVRFSGTRKFRLVFFDSARISQQLSSAGLVVEPHLLAVRDLTRDSITHAIADAVRAGFFEQLGPMPELPSGHGEGVVEIDADDVYLWIEQRASICLKATCKGDPAELTSTQARRLAAVLIDFADQIDQEDRSTP